MVYEKYKECVDYIELGVRAVLDIDRLLERLI
jgi:hypothetical protein